MFLFKKSKSQLEISIEVIELLVRQTNDKIKDIGIYDYDLYSSLIRIQEQFDIIRNVPAKTQLEYTKIKDIGLSWKHQVERIESDYKEALNQNIGSGVAGSMAGLGVATLGPTVAMGVATTFGVASTGTAISTLSGAAATNAALAWLGGGTIVAGGGGIAAGNAILALTGPVGWIIVVVSILGSTLFWWKAKSNRNRLEQIFLLISEREQESYKLAIIELNERITRIKEETLKLKTAIPNIVSFGTDYLNMTEKQQYTLGAYVNLMRASTQLLINPILGLQPKYGENDFTDYTRINSFTESGYFCLKHKDIIIYLANLMYKITTDESDRKLLSKAFRRNKKFRESMKLQKSDLKLYTFNIVDEVLRFSYMMNK